MYFTLTYGSAARPLRSLAVRSRALMTFTSSVSRVASNLHDSCTSPWGRSDDVIITVGSIRLNMCFNSCMFSCRFGGKWKIKKLVPSGKFRIPQTGPTVADPGEAERIMSPPRPCKISHKEDGCQMRPHRFHFSCPPPIPSRWICYWPTWEGGGGGRPTIILAIFSWKLLEIEKNGSGDATLVDLLDPPIDPWLTIGVPIFKGVLILYIAIIPGHLPPPPKKNYHYNKWEIPSVHH